MRNSCGIWGCRIPSQRPVPHDRRRSPHAALTWPRRSPTTTTSSTTQPDQRCVRGRQARRAPRSTNSALTSAHRSGTLRTLLSCERLHVVPNPRCVRARIAPADAGQRPDVDLAASTRWLDANDHIILEAESKRGVGRFDSTRVGIRRDQLPPHVLYGRTRTLKGLRRWQLHCHGLRGGDMGVKFILLDLTNQRIGLKGVAKPEIVQQIRINSGLIAFLGVMRRAARSMR